MEIGILSACKQCCFPPWNVLLDFDNGVTYTYPAEYLRVYSPSAEVVGHSPGEERVASSLPLCSWIEIECRFRMDENM